MNTLKRFCNAISFLLMGATVCAFAGLVFFAQGGELRLPAGNVPMEREHGYSHNDNARLDAKYRELLSSL